MDIIISTTPPTTTRAFSVYWSFAAERQKVYIRRLAGYPRELLTDDPVIAIYRFTNAYRAADRVSQYLIRSVQYNRPWAWADTFVRTLVFKIFNRIDIWRYLLKEIGEPDSNLLFEGAIDAALERIAGTRPIYSAAYIMPPPRSSSGPKYMRHLSLLRRMVKDRAHVEIKEAQTMADAYTCLRRYESIGAFLAYQFVTDLNYSQHLEFSEDDFVVPGPGSLRGLRKCFSDGGSLSDPDLLRWTAERQHEEFEYRGYHWEGLWGRDLHLIDIQNLFCEVDKYTRVKMPDLAPFGPGKRIKQLYRPDCAPMTAWFPPKWGINDRIPLSPNADGANGQFELPISGRSLYKGESASV